MFVNKKILIPLSIGLIVQVCTAWNSLFFHSDEYFQIIEFASFKYNITPFAKLPWEFAAEIRPTLQVHLFAWFYKIMTAIGIRDRFFIVSLLYTIIGISFFTVSNYLIINKFRNKTFFVSLLWINNFFWLVPFLRCRYSSEIISAFFWISGVILLEKLLSKRTSLSNAFFLFFTGLVFALSFYCRFQIIFALIGLAPWFFIQYKNKWDKAFIILSGFAAGIGLNILLDKLFYGHWVFTPYRYFLINIIDGKASSFGTSPWWFYVVVLMLAGIPFAGFVLFSFFIKGLGLYKNPFALGSLFFIIGHSLIGHKEERFMFPVILIMVYLAAEAYTHFPVFSQKAKALWKHGYLGMCIRIACYFSAVVNIILVVLLCAETYKQPVLFIKNFNAQMLNDQHIISFKQHPYETESGLRYTFLSQNKYNTAITVINNKDVFIKTLQQHPYFKYCILLSDARKNKLNYLLENKHGVVASAFVWKAANWLGNKYNIVIPDLWICQTYKEVSPDK